MILVATVRHLCRTLTELCACCTSLMLLNGEICSDCSVADTSSRDVIRESNVNRSVVPSVGSHSVYVEGQRISEGFLWLMSSVMSA